MVDFIHIEKIWQDNELIELRIICSSAVIMAAAKIYVSNALIDDLIYQIKQFLDGHVMESIWANEEKGNGSTACVSFRFLHKDKLGHLLVEVFLELEDGGDYSSHNCCFYINTEIGLLSKFCEELPQIKQKQLGINIMLNEDGYFPGDVEWTNNGKAYFSTDV